MKSCLGVISFVALLLFSGYGTAEAVKAHPDACNTCHRMPGANPRAINSLCLACHVSSGTAEAQAAGVFSPAAASNAFNHNASAGTGAGSQTSHFWGGSKTADPAAGSQNPPTTFYSSRNQISTGLVTCSICHDPHNDMATTTKLLRTTTAATADLNDAVCKQCHAPYYIDNPSAVLTHPVGPSAVPTIDPLKFNTPVVNIGSGNIQFFNGSVSCSSCHSTHFADSDSTTADGKGQTLVAGDGKLLRTDGPAVTDPDPQVQANRRSAVCTACHPYKTHGNATESLSCFVCHSVHNPTAATNVFVLRSSVTTATYGTVTGLSYTTVPPLDLTGSTSWADTGATTNGYCEKCHGNLLNTDAGGISESRLHIEGENCRTCHVHHKADATRSFAAAGGCDGCHGYPPSANVVGGPNGYAAGYTLSTFKDESITPHAAHAAGSGNYSFSCSSCHLNNNHNSANSFQDVFLGGSYSSLASGNGNMTPTYNGTGLGTCAAVYCHSNGGARTSDIARTYTAAAIPAWTAGSTTGAITTCNACHDNSNAMTNGSAAHAAHLALAGVTCKTCHVTTADSATALAAGAIGSTHVNGTINVAFDTSGFITVGATPYTAATGTCAVYCHSNGVSFASPDWDVATSGDCGACHQYSLAGVATGSGTPLSATHNKHLYASANGVQLACTTCHTNAGSGVDHVNGSVSFVANYQTAVCNLCHGASNGVTTGDDRQPIWNNTASVDCQTCHAGSVTATISSKSAANKSTATSTGHNKASGTYGVSGNVAANKLCSSCHDSTAAGHFDGITGDDMRLLPAAANCTTSCHGVGGSAVKDGIVSHQAKDCSVCHDPHGSSNIYMISATSAGNYGGTVVFTAKTGTDSYDEDDTVNSDDLCATCHIYSGTMAHNTRSNEGVAHNEGTNCFSCHKSHTEPSGAFIAGAGNACNDCHGFPPANAAHAKHAESATNDASEDRTDCEACHTGAASYTYSPAEDQGASLNHGNVTGRKSILTTSVGYNLTDQNCATACHKSTAADGFWTDTDLNCNACHYYSATPTSTGNNAGVANAKTGTYQLTGTHNQHFDAGAVCSDCHGTLPTDMTHITMGVGSDAAKILGKAKAEMDEASIDTVGLVATDPDPGNATCANIACHNPSNGAYSATWTVTIADCSTCHSATNPGTGSHGEHMGAATIFGINTVACTSCHANNGTNNAHRNGSVTFVAGMNYSGGAQAPLGTNGTCNTSTCHNDGTVAATPVVSPQWGTVSADCTICHGYAPATGEHAKHFANTTYVDGGCADCHTAETATTHIDGSRNMASLVTDMDLVTVGNQLTAPGTWNGTCANSCHIADTAGDWTTGGTLACTDCHGSGKLTTPALDRGWPPSSGAHAAHLGNTIYVTGANCTDCHNNNT
ncbi:MAG: CxxxxCH/CxxCH domain-containing protein, partial [Desulfuromonadales bacterium]|nr:CxxxxCH/CxxCH domain-containing protein [Desulfuromonadales bacterium]